MTLTATQHASTAEAAEELASIPSLLASTAIAEDSKRKSGLHTPIATRPSPPAPAAQRGPKITRRLPER